MVQLALKRKESRLLWEVLVRGIQATDAAARKTPSTDHDAYLKLRGKVLRAWKAGIIVGGIRPKKRIHDILPGALLKETEFARLRKADRRAKAKAKRGIAVPNHVGGAPESARRKRARPVTSP